MALEVLEHLPNPESLLRALAPKCKKAVVISVPNSGYWLHRLRFLCGRVPAQWRKHPGEHLRFWTLKDLKWWVSAIGWELKELRPYEGMLGLNRLFPSWCGMGVVIKIAPKNRFISFGRIIKMKILLVTGLSSRHWGPSIIRPSYRC